MSNENEDITINAPEQDKTPSEYKVDEAKINRNRVLRSALDKLARDPKWRHSVIEDLKNSEVEEGIGQTLSTSHLAGPTVSYDDAVQLGEDIYAKFIPPLKNAMPKNIWDIAIDFMEAMMNEQPDKAMTWADQFFLKRAIEKEKALGNRTYSLEHMLTEVQIESDKPTFEDPFQLEAFISKCMQDGDDVDGKVKIPMEELLEHVRTITFGEPVRELQENFYYNRFQDD